jgi:xylulokinase
MPTFLGLDVGTQGVRAVACTVDDAARACAPQLVQAAQPFPSGVNVTGLPLGHAEQQPAGWWQAATACLRQLTAQLQPARIRALSVTSTSGTLCLLDGRGEPLRPAVMYNDARARQEASAAQTAGAELAGRLGYRFNASFALAKLLWLARYEPAALSQARYIVHAADFLIGRLCGAYDVTDSSNALKTGYDIEHGGWPAFIAQDLGLPTTKLPRVVSPGTVIGAVTQAAAEQTGLAAGTLVAAGMTDGCAAQIAAGAVAPGDWNSTLGTTLVLKGVTEQLLRDPQGRIYCHRHPDGYWLPGGASNVGGEILAQSFPGADLTARDQQAARLSPGAWVAYPLARRGERFPFVQPEAEGFLVPFTAIQHFQAHASRILKPELSSPASVEVDTPPSQAAIYTAYLEGIAYVERLAYATLEALGAVLGDAVHVAGGAARSDVWLQIRADILRRELWRPVEPGAAMGAAILAASRTHFDGLIPAARTMVQIGRIITPQAAHAAAYDERFECFRAECIRRGYSEPIPVTVNCSPAQTL